VIYEPGQVEKVISFLTIGNDIALMFDTGLGIRNVVVLNSRTHYDHIGGNHLFDTTYGAPLEYSKIRLLEIPREAVAEFRSRAFEIDKFGNDVEQIDVGGRVLEILFTSGHAPYPICLIDRVNRLLFTGDTFYLAPLYTHLAGSSFDDCTNSAARLAPLAGEIDVAILRIAGP
jgi:glyoxylase-like metal-dependent hydrolase (beta-lactamase superfamily II)